MGAWVREAGMDRHLTSVCGLSDHSTLSKLIPPSFRRAVFQSLGFGVTGSCPVGRGWGVGRHVVPTLRGLVRVGRN